MGIQLDGRLIGEYNLPFSYPSDIVVIMFYTDTWFSGTYPSVTEYYGEVKTTFFLSFKVP